jgi:hypothetical protein
MLKQYPVKKAAAILPEAKSKLWSLCMWTKKKCLSWGQCYDFVHTDALKFGIHIGNFWAKFSNLYLKQLKTTLHIFQNWTFFRRKIVVVTLVVCCLGMNMQLVEVEIVAIGNLYFYI